MMKLLLDGKTAVVDQEAFDALYDYSASLPTGTTIGKRWKRRKNYHDESQGWILGEYAECSPPDPQQVRIIWRELEVV